MCHHAGKLLSLIAASVLVASAGAAQTLPIPQGDVRVVLTTEWLSATERFDHEGRSIPFDPRLESGTGYRRREFAIGASYGLLEHVSVGLTVPLRQLTLAIPPGPGEEVAEFDLGDLELGLGMGLSDRLRLGDSWLVAAGLTLHVPAGYRRNAVPATGSGQVDADLWGRAGARFLNDVLELSAGAAYRLRTGIFGFSRAPHCPPGPVATTRCFVEHERPSFGDELLFDVRIAGTVWDRVSLVATGDVAWSVRRPEAVQARGGIYQPEWFTERRVAWMGGQVRLRLFGATFVGAGVGWPVYGRNAPDGSILRAGLIVGG